MGRELHEQARELRRQGKSVSEIMKVLGVSKGSVSLWVRGIELSVEQQASLKARQRQWGGQNKGASVNRSKGREQRLTYQKQGREAAKNGDILHLKGCMLYWAEGAKARNTLIFVNSDPNMMLLFKGFLSESMAITDEEIAIYIHCHFEDTQIHQQIGEYWLNLLNLPRTCLKKIFVKVGSNTRHNRLENGVCTIRVYKQELVQHIFGAIQEYGGFENPAWLG